MKQFILYLLPGLICAQTINITADKSIVEEKKHKITFIGHVNIKKGFDELRANKAIIYINAKNCAINAKNCAQKYEAFKDIRIKIKLDNKQIYNATSQYIEYNVSAKTYTLKDQVVLKDLSKNLKLKGDEIFVDVNQSYAKVLSSNKEPVTIEFDLNETK